MDELYLTEAGIGFLISVLLEVTPKLKTWWGAREPKQKQSIVLGIIAALSVVGVGLDCFYYDVCPADWVQVLRGVSMAFLAGMTGTVVAHSGTKLVIRKEKKA